MTSSDGGSPVTGSGRKVALRWASKNLAFLATRSGLTDSATDDSVRRAEEVSGTTKTRADPACGPEGARRSRGRGGGRARMARCQTKNNARSPLMSLERRQVIPRHPPKPPSGDKISPSALSHWSGRSPPGVLRSERRAALDRRRRPRGRGRSRRH